ncbi:acidic leucine-rich nuclear phosphoprotein 32 family member A isoform X2 [Anastrepha ludens]|uniref:acidic leucine-rich nuclear phosphoprotein 32 family member A isoform X2 n=1 Tax=Anastrepha ludens TaxID=28586 RepID=UPI0023AF155D|nr:acidic leucine-rich nuclear phosphoprotein 32 family member A isoform X2 [Anastrepha ludens]
MEKRIELERRARKANQITELNLDNCRSTSIVGLTDEYTALESLSLINVGLTTLKGFPKLPNLKKLELSDNRISNGLNYLTTSPKLQYLNLSGNKIKDLETLKPLEEFKHLAVLDLFNNEATQIENYREKIFEMVKSLKFLDGFDANDVEAPSDGEDDDEVNLNDDEEEGEDKQNKFCLNGIEIDLDELEDFERRVKAKKQLQDTTATKNQKAADEIDDLDELLKEIKLKDAASNSACDKTSTAAPQSPDTRMDMPSTGDGACNNTGVNVANAPPLPFALILYWFLAILNLANASFYSCDEEDYGSSYVSTSDVSLSEVYNEDLEEDNSEWDEENAVEDEDEDTDDDDTDGEGDGEGNVSAKAAAGKEKSTSNSAAAKADAADADNKNAAEEAAEEEPQARGKKRKHDG